MQYNYFPLLNTTSKQNSCQLKGPCYPVLTVNTDFFTTCRYTVRDLAFVFSETRPEACRGPDVIPRVPLSSFSSAAAQQCADGPTDSEEPETMSELLHGESCCALRLHIVQLCLAGYRRLCVSRLVGDAT